MRTLFLVAVAALVFVPQAVSAAPKAVPETFWSYNRSVFVSSLGSETQINRIYKDEEEVSVYYLKNKRFTEEGKRTAQLGKYDQAIWDFFLKVAGDAPAYKNIAAYATYRIGKQSQLAEVVFIQKKNPAWGLVVNANNAAIGNVKWQRDMIITLMHEYGHIITLTKPQMDYKVKEKTCERNGLYFVDQVGCTKKAGYLDAFTKKFWTADAIEVAEDARSDGSTRFYKQHEKDFVSEYAASSPEEDIAESFTDFVLRTKPVGTSKAEEKIRFFYQYPELVTMRNEMRARIAPYFGN